MNYFPRRVAGHWTHWEMGCLYMGILLDEGVRATFREWPKKSYNLNPYNPHTLYRWWRLFLVVKEKHKEEK